MINSMSACRLSSVYDNNLITTLGLTCLIRAPDLSKYTQWSYLFCSSDLPDLMHVIAIANPIKHYYESPQEGRP